ncbi:MAG: hypothetical protein ISR76_10245 [Planctomycetes bacterium]|nr:hypothetical protein [Planctomycetota bacterium]MBL7009369.1 hypothetical protein [Planctomycetota bacterium]
MENHPEPDRLPERLEASLRQLGGVRAPDELWRRVALGISEPVEAPAELWDRVEPEVRAAGRPRPVLVFRRVAAAAAVVAVFALGFLLSGRDKPVSSQPAFAYFERVELRDSYLSRSIPITVQEDQLSPAARMLAGSMGAAVEGRL